VIILIHFGKKLKEVDGYQLECDECGVQFGIDYFEYSVKQPDNLHRIKS